MASVNSMLCTIFLCDGIASFKPHCMSVIQLIDNIVSDSMIDVISHLSIDIAIKGPTLYSFSCHSGSHSHSALCNVYPALNRTKM